MATYFFETITDAQAAGFSSTADNLVFSTTGEAANITTVRYNAATATSGATITLISGLTGKAVTFNAAIAGENPIFPDGSQLFIGAATADTPAAFGSTGDGLYGGLGDDVLDAGNGNNLVQGNGGDDALTTGSGNDTVYGGQNDDTIIVGSGSNFAQGNLGDDVITGGSGTDTLLGGKNDDVITGGGGNDFLNGNLGDDNIVLAGGAGSGGSDTVFGEDGDDVVTSIGNATVTATASNEGAVINVDLGAGADAFTAGNSTQGGGEASFNISGGDDDDTISIHSTSVLGTAVNTLQGNAGDDVISSDNIGKDVVLGGQGDDNLTVAGGGDLVNGNLGDDVIVGGTGAAGNTLIGEDGDDNITGGGGADSINAGADNDVVASGGGADNVSGGDGDDMITNANGAGDVIDGGAGIDNITGADSTSATLTGADNISGGDGNDIINSGSGADIVSGGNGADVINSEEGNDVVTGGEGKDVIDAGDDNDNVDAGGGNDVLGGGLGDDTLQGGDGDDVITGGAGTDFLRGGNGSDVFVFGTAGNSGVTAGLLDQILDWQNTDALHFGAASPALPGAATDGANYLELTASSYDAALVLAQGQIAHAGATVDYVVVQVGSDVVVFADTGNTNAVTDAVTLVGRTLADISADNVI